MNQKNTLIAILIVVIVIILGWLWYAHTKPARIASTIPSTQPASQQVNVPSSEMPKGFPSDIPLESGAEIVQNYNANVNGMSQATRVWVTTQTLDQEFQIYQNFFSNPKNGWTVQNTVNQTDLKSITANKGSTQAAVNISQNSVNGQKTVNISVSWPN